MAFPFVPRILCWRFGGLRKEVAAFERGAGLAPAAEEFTFVILIKVDRVNVVAITRQADDTV
jgi:hypothetical protein